MNAANINHFSNIEEFQDARNETTKFRKLVLLFDIIADPGESKDLSEKNPELTNKLLALLADHFVCLPCFRIEKAHSTSEFLLNYF